MCDKNLTNAEKWKIHQAKVLLESLCVDIEHSVNLEVEGVNLIVSRDNSVMECNKCGEKWEVETIMLKNGRLRLRAYIQKGMGYVSSYKCPNKCNENKNWRENICWCSVLNNCD